MSGKYYYYKGGKQTVYSKSCDKWKTGKTQYYFGKGNKSATYVYYSDKKILKNGIRPRSLTKSILEYLL